MLMNVISFFSRGKNNNNNNSDDNGNDNDDGSLLEKTFIDYYFYLYKILNIVFEHFSSIYIVN